MGKRFIKLMALICITVSLFSFAEPRSATAASEYEVNYVFKSEDGISITHKALQLYKPENYYFQECIDDYYNDEPAKTYRLYEKDTGEPAYIGGVYENLVLFNDDVYLMKDGVCIVNRFYFIGEGENGCEYWIYFGNDGKMAKDAVIYGTFKLDKNGLFNYRQSDLYNRKLKADKDYIPDVKDVTDILNKKKASNLGKWVKTEDYKPGKPLSSVDGHFEEDKKGRLRFWANSVLQNKSLTPVSSSIFTYYKYIEGYQYQPDDTYDWKTTELAENEYLKDILIEIDGDYYYFDNEGYAAKNKWVFVNNADNYFDKEGKRVSNDWVARDGELYRLDDDGCIMKNCWVNEGNKHLYLSYDGTIYYSAKEKECNVFNKIEEFRKIYPENTEVGICAVFADMMVKYLFGKNTKGKKYAYDWDKIKVGDTIAGDNHIFVVMAKDRYCITAAESNNTWDLSAHYGRVPLDKEGLDELKKKGKMRYTFTTYYSAEEYSVNDFKPQKAKLSAQKSNNTVAVELDKSEGAVGYCIYMSNSRNGEYKLIKTIKAENELKYTVKNLSAGEYYFKARAYRIINGRKVWGDYSNIIKCKLS